LTLPKNKFLPLLISFLITVHTSNAQQLTMSSMGSMGNTSGLSAAINFKSNVTCIDVQSGIAVLNGTKGFGAFAVNCELKQQFNMLGLKLYPNPVSKSTKVKFTNTPPLTENFNITIWSTEGELVKTLKATGYTLFQGIVMDLSTITPGGYVIKIESSQYVEALKFIKTN
jgi:hypothetical protein